MRLRMTPTLIDTNEDTPATTSRRIPVKTNTDMHNEIDLKPLTEITRVDSAAGMPLRTPAYESHAHVKEVS